MKMSGFFDAMDFVSIIMDHLLVTLLYHHYFFEIFCQMITIKFMQAMRYIILNSWLTSGSYAFVTITDSYAGFSFVIIIEIFSKDLPECLYLQL